MTRSLGSRRGARLAGGELEPRPRAGGNGATLLINSGWGMPGWPKAWYRRGLPMALEPVVEEELQRVGAVGVAKMGIRKLAAATIMAHGTRRAEGEVSAAQPDRRGHLVPVVQ